MHPAASGSALSDVTVDRRVSDQVTAKLSWAEIMAEGERYGVPLGRGPGDKRLAGKHHHMMRLILNGATAGLNMRLSLAPRTIPTRHSSWRTWSVVPGR
jgi:hypothetical protein